MENIQFFNLYSLIMDMLMCLIGRDVFILIMVYLFYFSGQRGKNSQLEFKLHPMCSAFTNINGSYST